MLVRDVGDVREGYQIRRAAGIEAECAFLEAGRVCHQVGQRNRLRVGRGNLQCGQVIVDVAVKVQSALLDKLHDRSPGKQFRDRSRAEQGSVGTYGCQRLAVGITVALEVSHVPVTDECDAGPGDVIQEQLVGDDPVDEALQVLPCDGLLRNGSHLRQGRGREVRQTGEKNGQEAAEPYFSNTQQQPAWMH